MMEAKKRNLSVRFTTILTLVLVLFAIPIAAAERGVTDDEIKVGSLWDRSGPIKNTSSPAIAGLESYLKYINSKGGVHGRKFKIYPADGQYKPEKVLYEYKRLVKLDNIFMLFGPGNTGAGMALAPLIERDKVPEITMMPSNQIIFPPRKYCFVVSTPRLFGAKVLMDYIFHGLKLKNPKIAVVYPNIDYGKFFLKAFEERAKFYNTTLTAKLIQNLSDVNAVSQVLKLKSLQVDVVLLPTIEKCANIFLKDAASYNFHPIAMGPDPVTHEELLKLLGNEKAKKYIGFTAYAASYEDIPGSALIKKLADMFPEAKKYSGGRYFTCGVVQGMVAVEAFKRAGRDLTVDGFVKAMDSLKQK